MADILRRYGAEYRQKYEKSLLPSHRQVMRAIEDCRTETLGGQVYYCEECGARAVQLSFLPQSSLPKMPTPADRSLVGKTDRTAPAGTLLYGDLHAPIRIARFCQGEPAVVLQLAVSALCQSQSEVGQRPPLWGWTTGNDRHSAHLDTKPVLPPHIHYLCLLVS